MQSSRLLRVPYRNSGGDFSDHYISSARRRITAGKFHFWDRSPSCLTAAERKVMAPELGDLTENEKKLYELINEGNVSEVRRLAAEKAVRIDCLDEHGMTPLQNAAYRGNREIAEILLSHGADVNNNYHDQGYTTLMFAALAGSQEVTRLLLEAGARTNATNKVGRTATQMAAFVGQHQCVSLINNFFSKEDLEYYTVPRGLETEPKLPPHLASVLYRLILNNNLSPVKISYYLRDNPELLDEVYKVTKLLDLLCEKNMKARETNEVLAIKFHYLATVIRQAEKSRQEKGDKLEAWIKRMVHGRPEDGFPEEQERLIRSTLKDFPYIDSNLLQHIVRSLAKVKIGEDPSALSALTSSINGQRMARDEDMPCSVCSEMGAEKKCSACKMVNYCNQECQKLHWPSHKKFCKSLHEMYLQIQERKKQEAEEQERRQEEEAKLAAEEAQKAVENGETNGGEKTDEEKQNGDTADGSGDMEPSGKSQESQESPDDTKETEPVTDLSSANTAS